MNMNDLNIVDMLIEENKTNKSGTKKQEDEYLKQDSQVYGHVTDKDMQEQSGIRYGNITSEDNVKEKLENKEEVSQPK
ncbi:hypothetical protein ACFFHH_05815 [Cytobacillus solani]|uniref:hypothetical protein n=1 Tax=Cytobacillus solani TaxID=1637975 RepID=UPI00114FAD48|nr:hypothetical protein [Cytobacillus solani]USK53069.1 hypothetical protein LIS82_15740 [Cytobacillus solani]